MTILQPGVVGGRYRLGELLGSGGMADVYRAHDDVLQRDVAVKLLRNPADPVHRARFASEASTLAGLRHPHVVTLLDAGLAEDVPFLAMDLIEGHTLAQLVAEAPLSPQRARTVGAQVARGLAHAHAHGIVHRDVKPGNILLDRNGTAYLTDFGIARLLGAVDGHTRADELVGSPAFLAPEQVEAGELTPAADVYSLGLVLLEVLTGTRAYPGSPVEAAIARLRVAPMIPTSLGPELGTLLQRMTRLDPSARPSADEVAEVLEGRSPLEPAGAGSGAAIATGALVVPPDADPLDPPRTTIFTPPQSRPAARRRRGALLVGAAAVVAVAALAVPTALAGDERTGASTPEAAASPTPSAPGSESTRSVTRTVSTTSTAPARSAPQRKAPAAHKTVAPGKAKKHGPAKRRSGH